jgi:hypothetical protein
LLLYALAIICHVMGISHHLPPPTKTQNKADSPPNPSSADDNIADVNDPDNNAKDDDADVNTANDDVDNDVANDDADNNALMQTMDNDADNVAEMQTMNDNADNDAVMHMTDDNIYDIAAADNEPDKDAATQTMTQLTLMQTTT